jgi:sterol 24-C-methyltransferase
MATATLHPSHQQNVPAVVRPTFEEDTPRSSNTSASNEKIDFSTAHASRKWFFKHHDHAFTVDRSASPKRRKTFWKSFKYLRDLSPEQVNNFMASYVIYNLDWNNEDEMVAALGPDYQQKVGDCLRAYYGVINHL